MKFINRLTEAGKIKSVVVRYEEVVIRLWNGETIIYKRTR